MVTILACSLGRSFGNNQVFARAASSLVYCMITRYTTNSKMQAENLEREYQRARVPSNL